MYHILLPCLWQFPQFETRRALLTAGHTCVKPLKSHNVLFTEYQDTQKAWCRKERPECHVPHRD